MIFQQILKLKWKRQKNEQDGEWCSMAKFRCGCGWEGKPVIMEPAQKVCPKCGSVRLEKVRKEESI